MKPDLAHVQIALEPPAIQPEIPEDGGLVLENTSKKSASLWRNYDKYRPNPHLTQIWMGSENLPFGQCAAQVLTTISDLLSRRCTVC